MATIVRSPLYAFRSWHLDPENVAIRSQPLGTPRELSIEYATQIPSYEYFNPIIRENFNSYGVFRFGGSPTLFPPTIILNNMFGAGNAVFNTPRQIDAASTAFAGNSTLNANAVDITASIKLGQASFIGSSTLGVFLPPLKLQPRDPTIIRIWPQDSDGVAIRSQPLGSPRLLNLVYATVIPAYEWANPIYPPCPDSSIIFTDNVLLVTPQSTVNFYGAGNFFATRLPIQTSAIFAGSGQFASNGVSTAIGVAAFIGSGSFASNGVSTAIGFANFAGSGQFASNGVSTAIGFANFAGASVLSTLQTPLIIIVNNGGVLFGGIGRVDIFGPSTVTWTGNTSLTGNGILTIPSATSIEVASTALAGSGSFNPDTAAYEILSVSATFSGNGAFTASSYQVEVVSVTLSGTGFFVPDELPTTFIQAAVASFQGSGAISGLTTQIDAAAAIQTGQGILNASPTQIAATSGIMSGSGTFTATSVFTSATNPVTFTGNGALFIYITKLLISAHATFSGTGNLLADGERIPPKAKVLKSPGRIRLLISPGRKYPNTT